MENEIELIMEEIEKEPEKLKQMLRIKEVDELYQFFKENGYKQSLEKFKEGVLSFLESSEITPQEDSDLENVAGGMNIANKFKKATSVGLASLLALGAPMSHAAGAKVPSKPVAQSNSTKKILKYIGITVGAPSVALLGIGAPIFAIWKYKKYLNNKNSSKFPIVLPPDQHEENEVSDKTQELGQDKKVAVEQPNEASHDEDQHEETKPPVENHESTDILGGSSHSSPIIEMDETTSSTTITDSSDLSNQESEDELSAQQDLSQTKIEVKEETKPVIEDLPSPQVKYTAYPAQKENPQTAENKETEVDTTKLTDEQLIERVLAGSMVEPFRMLDNKDKRIVIELVRKIQELLGEEAENLGQLVHGDAQLRCIKNTFALSWFRYICNALDGYLHGQKQKRPLEGGIGGVLSSSLYSLILSFVFCESKIKSDKIENVKKCIQYLYDNFEKYNFCAKSNELSPDKLIKEFHWFNGNEEFSNELMNKYFTRGLCRSSSAIIVFVHLLYSALQREFKDLSGATFRRDDKNLSSEMTLFDYRIISGRDNFEILKDNQSIGTFNFKFDYVIEIATLKKVAENNAGFEYTYNLNNEQITSQEINN